LFGRDARETSPELAGAVARGICDAGPKVLDLGMAGTEEMYWAVTEFGATAGICIIGGLTRGNVLNRDLKTFFIYKN
jgi:phosphomannomutase